MVATIVPPVTTTIWVHVVPLPVNPALHAQELVPGPVMVHVALAEQPPLLVEQLLTAVQVVPLPEYPVLQAHELVPGPVMVHVALVAHPPLLVEQLLTAMQVVPLPV